MLNIELQCCGLVMLIILLLIFTKEKGLDYSNRRLYFRALVSCTICLSLDIISIFAIYWATYGSFSHTATMIICKLYVISLVLQAWQAFSYTAGEFFAKDRHKKLHLAYRIWLFAGFPFILFLPTYYFMDGRVVYSYGPSNIAAYIVVIVLIISTIAMAFRRVDQSSGRRRWAILLWQGLWMLAALIQFLVPELLLSGFAAAMGMLLIHAELENPHDGIDRMTGQFTSNALLTYVADRYQHRLGFASLYIRIEYLARNIDLETEKTVMLRCANYLDETEDAFVFRLADDSFVMIYKNREEMEADYARIAAGIDAAIDMPVDISFVQMPDSGLVNTSDEFFRLQHYFETDSLGQKNVVVDAGAVETMRNYSHVQELIRSALHEGRVEVFYQPFYDVQRKRFTAAEALVRIRDKDGTLVPPASFIPIAEENGLIVPLGIEIFRQVCEFLARGEAQELGLDSVEVNISVAQFDKENPADFVQKLIEMYSIDPKLINLEITETTSNAAKQILLRNMNKLIDFGVRFSLDDFGTGRSNLDYFVEMPVDRIKFDYSFTQHYFENEKARYVLESMIEMIHKLKLSIVAEGVETKEQLDTMCALGVEYIQGFYFSQALPEEDFLAFLRKKNGK